MQKLQNLAQVPRAKSRLFKQKLGPKLAQSFLISTQGPFVMEDTAGVEGVVVVVVMVIVVVSAEIK